MNVRVSYLILVISMSCSAVYAQNDSTRTPGDSSNIGILNNKIAKELLKTVQKKTTNELTQKNVKSEDVFMPYQGKIIRNIIVKHINFERSIYDTALTIKDVFTRTAEKLHADTKPNIIFNHLLFHKNKPLDPYRFADNERYLRDLDFILDSKITVYSVAPGSDSVDVEVVTRDVFSLGFRPGVSSFDKYRLSVYDANLMGRGQRLQADFLFEGGRTPGIGKGVSYTKSSVGGSLVNLSVAYTELNRGPSIGEENEYSYYLRLDRPLVSAYSRLAGGMEVSRNWSVNVDNEADSLFRNYRYTNVDNWIGYNIGIKKDFRDRSRFFVAMRYAEERFDVRPQQIGDRVRRLYNNNTYVLAGVTFYNQRFYKTNFVYGFGRTEDVPYGTNISVNTGWTEELGLRRLYLGGTAIKTVIRPSGRFYSVELGVGSFFNKKDAEDGVAYTAIRYFSKLYEIGKKKIRHQITAGYGKTFNNRIFDLLTINNQLPNFTADSLYGKERIFFRTETTVYMPGQLLGFRFAPFASIELANLNQYVQGAFKRNFFYGVTGGIRVRNENLIFGTVEFRVVYFPVTVPGVDQIAIRVTSNLRIKYSGSFVRPPSFVTYNQ